MKMLKKLTFGALVVLLPLSAKAAIPGTTAAADSYEITVTKVELCRTSACAAPYTLGSGNKTFDISSATAGADVGQYISLEDIPLYQTWSHVRVTISTTISIKGQGTDNAPQACKTGTGLASGAHTAVGTGVVAVGAGTLQSLVIPNDNVGGLATADYTAFNFAKTAGAATATITYALSTPYTCKGTLPRIEVKFNTSAALGLVQTGAGTCGVFPRPPDVTITATDP
ncbi:hypothetical protein [Magnetovibrio blakemorei]|uniref:Spore coat protein U domain-containing protein n=1 Tax=Magnetovibrio blakemorei TaxID=28181 RepID=A0A1E5QAB6_9PROT|nr:hypothetical protein [Magnetovibrio blakemorei]OEJ68890.1 hypothetical protein BEN30_05105 [Magnetovibrio blakemorei]